MLLLLISSCKISHLGMKPVRGGRPPKDRRVSRMMMVVVADLFHRPPKDLILVTFDRLSVRNMVRVAMI